ncbi:MAG: polynucleotide adenylyltransferase PcnB [Thermoanaerobaculia bacterium]|nr:polynucleotide adenylyltransferase PcnB [Thermoanaerobaculia bacterium]
MNIETGEREEATETEHAVPSVPVVVDREHHCISRTLIPESTLKVLYRLHRSGFKAYLCGGSVRDMLMSRTPKDFDIATDAHPMQVRRLFRNSRIIGRRFRLVHVVYQEGVVEVATFRREPGQRDDGELLVTDDNTFGTPEQDARRRDFTINGLFYNIADFSIIDYVSGLADLDNRLVRVIGDPDVRFREDPVRMMRAIEFASRLDFEIEADTWDAIVRHRDDILKASPARVSEEILELLRRGWSLDAFELLVETRLLEPLMPELFASLTSGDAEYFWRMLEVLDRTIQAGRVFGDGVFWAVLMLPGFFKAVEQEESSRGERLKPADAFSLVRDVVAPVAARLVFPSGVRHHVEQSLESLWRIQEVPSDRKSQWRLVFREHFGDALALFELHALSSGRNVELFKEWKAFARRVQRQEEPAPQAPRTGRRRRRRR